MATSLQIQFKDSTVTLFITFSPCNLSPLNSRTQPRHMLHARPIRMPAVRRLYVNTYLHHFSMCYCFFLQKKCFLLANYIFVVNYFQFRTSLIVSISIFTRLDAPKFDHPFQERSFVSAASSHQIPLPSLHTLRFAHIRIP